MRIGGCVASPFPAISTWAPLVGRDFVIGPGYSPIPNKIVSKIISSQFVELADLLPDNLKIKETEPQMFLGDKLVVVPARRQTMEIQDILTWVEAFTIYSLVLCLTAVEIGRSVTLLVFNNPDVKQILGQAWQQYDTAFSKRGGSLWSKGLVQDEPQPL